MVIATVDRGAADRNRARTKDAFDRGLNAVAGYAIITPLICRGAMAFLNLPANHLIEIGCMGLGMVIGAVSARRATRP